MATKQIVGTTVTAKPTPVKAIKTKVGKAKKKRYILTNKAGKRLGAFSGTSPTSAAKKAARRGHVDIMLRESGKKYKDGAKKIFCFEGSVVKVKKKPFYKEGPWFDYQQKQIIPGSKTKENPEGLVELTIGQVKPLPAVKIPGKPKAIKVNKRLERKKKQIAKKLKEISDLKASAKALKAVKKV
jgi:hypothetical protein